MTGAPADPRLRGQLTRRAAIASMSVALALMLLKAAAVWRSGSVSLLGSLADSTLDLIASLVTLLGVRWAAMPADHDHRFGHGKAEALAALFQVTLISMAAVGIAMQAIRRLGTDRAPAAPELGIGVSLIAILLSLALVAYQKRIVARTGSLAIGTDALHYQSDLLLNLSVIAALVLDQYPSFRGADPLLGLGIALWLGWGAWRAAGQAVDHLMDREWSVEERRHFLDVALRHPELRGIHDMRTRTSGPERFVQFHVSVDPDMTVRHAHQVMDQIEEALRREFPGVDILIHPDPYGYDGRDGQGEHGGDPLRAAEARKLLEEGPG
ncbi:iron transporter [Sphingobium jiangsuense]|uniref:Ferrous-iron efflux pump FieF n=1 Tax=Sphingobium jiangsuense TaxID=870476 RepID=A0A7W6BGE0_9SPHN|nr:cation diffusion facilitator family transporter [Sphingobium jiangsuense]MBB3924362.1 ferrous-iron efflux pump FieF [Sphingobium jiangsuense]GLT01730.1 iron transporter [Sphingobium jiangsuense]